MTPSWIRQLFAPKSQLASHARKRRQGTPARCGERMGLVQLEDRTTPSFSFGTNPPTLVSINEGQTLSSIIPSKLITGSATDSNSLATVLNLQVVSTSPDPLLPADGSGSFSSTLTSSGPPRFYTWGFDFTAKNGYGTPKTYQFNVQISNDRNDSLSDTPLLATNAFQIQINNVAPTLTTPTTAQVAVAGNTMGFNLGSFFDPGTEPSWTVQVDWDNDGTYDPGSTFSTTSKGSLFATHNYAAAGSHTAKVKVSDPDGGFDVQTFDVNVAASLGTTFVDDDWTITTDTGASGLSAGDTVAGGHLFGYDAWSTISDALEVTTTGGTTNVLAGKYVENVTISQAVQLLGPNAGVSAGVTPGTRVGEAVIVPGTNDAASGVVVSVTAANVMIDGFTIDGDNASLPSGVAVNGIDTNAATGVQISGVGGATVRNNIVQNFTSNGVRGLTGTAVGGTAITQNKIDNVPLDGPTFFGRGVLLQDNFYASVTDNVITRARTGIQTNNFSSANPGPAAVISGNTVTANVRGIFHNLHYANASTFTISGNTLTAGVGAPAGSGGLILASIEGAVAVTVSNNNVSGFTDNLRVWNIPTTAGITISGGMISNALSSGLNFTNVDDGYGDGNGNAKLTLDGVTFADNPTAIRVFDGSNNSSTLSLALTGVTVNGGGTGVLLSGADATLNNSDLADTAFDGTSQFIALQNTALATSTINATGVSFDGTLGADLTTANAFGVEDKITDFLDSSTLGYVRIKAANVFVTPLSGSIQRGIDAAAAGETVNVNDGLYKLSNTTANKPITIAGFSKAGTIIVPAAEDDNVNSSFGGTYQHGIIVSADNVTIRDLTIDGQGNLSLAADKDNFRAGVITPAGIPVSGLTVQNLSVKNIYRRGIQVSYTGSDNLITGNSVDHVLGAGAGSAYGIAAFDGNATITNNVISNTSFGIASNRLDYGVNGAYPLLTIQGNTVTASSVGLYISAAASGSLIGGATSELGNTIDISGGAGDDVGILVSYSAGAITVRHNSVIASSGDAGIWLGSNEDPLNPVLVADNILTATASTAPTAGQGTGIFITDDRDIFNGGAGVDAKTYATIQGNTVTGFYRGIDLYDSTPTHGGPKPLVATVGGASPGQGNTVSGSAEAIRVFGATATATITGNTIKANLTDVATGVRFTSGGTGSVTGNDFDEATDNGTDLRIDATAGAVTIGTGNQFGGDTYYIDNQSTQNYDLSANGTTFDAAAGPDRNFRIEDKVHHRVDTDLAVTNGLITWVTDSVFVTQPGVNSYDSSIQRGIDAASAGNTVNVEAGTYAEVVTVNKGITLLGSGKATTTIEPTTTGANNAVVNVTAPGVTIDGFTISVVQPTNRRGIYASGNAATVWNGLLIQNNTVVSSGAAINNTSRGIFVSDTGPGYNGTVTIRANAITAATGSAFWWGTELNQAKTATVGGANPADGNTFEKSVTLDLRAGFAAANGTTDIRNNSFAGGGVEVTEPNGGAATTIRENDFTPAVDGYRQAIFVNHNYTTGATVGISDNTFTVRNQGEAAARPGVGVFVGGSAGVTVDGNTFGAVAGATNFVYLLVDTQQREGSDGVQYGDDVPDSLTATDNDFTSSDVAGGRAIAFYNGNSTRVVTGTVSDSQYGAFVVGGAGTAANSFGGGLDQFIQYNTVRNPLFPGNLGPTVPGAVTLNLDASQNKFDVGDGMELPSAMDLADKFALEQKLFHKPDVNALGLITFDGQNVYVPNDQKIQGGIDAVPDGSDTWTVNVEAGTYAEQVTVNEDVTLNGAGQSDGTRIVAPNGLAINTAILNPLINVTASGATISNLQTEGLANPTNVDGISFASGVDGVVISNVTSSLSRYGFVIGGSAAAVTNLSLTGVVASGNGNGFAILADGKVNGLTISSSNFDNNSFGFSTQADTARTNNELDVIGVTISNTTFNNNASRGIRVEKLSNSQLGTVGGGITVNNSGAVLAAAKAAGSGYGAGIDIDLRFGTYTNVAVRGSVDNSGVGDPDAMAYTPGYAVSIVARPNFGASLTGLTLQNLTVTDPSATATVALAIGRQVALGATTLTNVSLSGAGGVGLRTFVAPSPAGQTLDLGSTAFGSNLALYISHEQAGVTVDATDAKFGSPQVIPSSLNLGSPTDRAKMYAIEDKINHQIDNAALGFVKLAPNAVFVTANSGAGAIQRGINSDGITAGGTVYVNSGTYIEDVNVDVPGLSLLGEGFDLNDPGVGTIISGATTGSATTVSITANNVTVAGFTITREGNNTTDWTTGLNTNGIAPVGTGIVIRDNLITGNRNGVIVDSGSTGNLTIRNNVVDFNRTGIHIVNISGPVTIVENAITNNWTMGVLLRNGDGSLGTVTAPITIRSNAIYGNWFAGIERRDFQSNTNVIDASGNWFGTNNPVLISNNAGNSGEPGYDTQIPVAFGGSAAPPVVPPFGAIPDILNSFSNQNLIDFSPFLWDGTDKNVETQPGRGTNGFQGDFSELRVTAQGAQIGAGRINEAIAYNGGSATTIHVLGGTYTEDVNLSRPLSPNFTVQIEGNVTGVGEFKGDNGATLAVPADKQFTYGQATGTATFAGAISGDGTVVKVGVGTSQLTGISTGFTGTLEIDAGTVQIGTDYFGTGVSVLVNEDATLSGGGTVHGDITVAEDGTMTMTGAVTGTLENSGTVSPTGINGALSVGDFIQTEDGVLEIDFTGGTPTHDQLVVSGDATLDGTLILNELGGTETEDFTTVKIIDNEAGGTTSGAFDDLANGEFVTLNGETFLFSNPGGDGNDVTLTKTPGDEAVGTTFVDDSWTGLDYTNGTAVDADPFTAGVQKAYIGYNAFATITPALAFTTDEGTVSVFGGTYTDPTVALADSQTLKLITGHNVVLQGTLSGTAGTTVNLNRGTLTAGAGIDAELASKITGVGPSNFVKAGTGKLTLTNPANDYKGTTKVLAGTLLAGTDEVIPDGSAVTVTAGTLDLNGFYETVGSLAGSGNVALDSGAGAPGGLTAGGNNTSTTFGGVISGQGGLVKVGTGTMTFTAAQLYEGGTTISTGTLKMSKTMSGVASVLGDIDTGSGVLELAGPATFSNKILGDGRVVVSGSGTTTLTAEYEEGDNVYTGGTTVNAGTLLVPDFDSLGSGAIAANGSAVVQVTATQTTGKTFTMTGGASLSVTAGQTLTLAGAQVSGGSLRGAVVATVDDQPVPVATQLVGVTLAADAVVSVSGAATFTGVTNNGRMSVGAGATATLNAFTNAAGGRISVNGVDSKVYVVGFTSAGYLEVNNGGLFRNNGTETMTFGGGSVINIGYTTSESASQANAGTGTFDLGSANALVRTGVLRNNGLVTGDPIPGNPDDFRVLRLENNSFFYTGAGVGGEVGDFVSREFRSGSTIKAGV